MVDDDLAFASSSQPLLDELKTNLAFNFNVKLFSKLTSLIGWNNTQDQDGITINQIAYIRDILHEFGMDKANGTRTPLPTKADLFPATEDETILSPSERNTYRSLIGSLLYLAVCTRPDISFSVSVLARQVHAPTKHHMGLLKRVLLYIAGTVHFGLMFPRSDKLSSRSLHSAVDVDWGGCRDTRKSTREDNRHQRQNIHMENEEAIDNSNLFCRGRV